MSNPVSNPNSDIGYEQTTEDIKKSKWLLGFTLLVIVIAVYLMVGSWPAASEDLPLNATSSLNSTNVFNVINEINSTRVVTLPLTEIKAFVGPETLLLFVMMLSGAIGACVYSFWAISDHLGRHHDFYYERWKTWYIIRPIVGAGLAMFFYLLIRGGLLTIGADSMTLNLVVIAGLSGLVGMFSEQAIRKLNDLADTLFGRSPNNNAPNTKGNTPKPPNTPP